MSNDPDTAGPLQGVTVIEMGQLLAGPYCGQLMADYGADVIKIEPPGVGDPLRAWGREVVDGEGYWWPIAARGKRSITVDLRTAEGQALVRDLVRDADVVLENFRPGTMERWNLGWEDLSAVNPAIVMVRVSGFGQTGPYSSRPGYASVGEAMGGLRYVVGDPERPPSRAGISIGDSLAAMFATLGALAALHRVRDTGEGQVVDASIYESVLAVMESIIPEYVFEGVVRERTGPFLPNVAPSNLYPTADGDWVVIAANQDLALRSARHRDGRAGARHRSALRGPCLEGCEPGRARCADRRLDGDARHRRAPRDARGALGRVRSRLPRSGDA